MAYGYIDGYGKRQVEDLAILKTAFSQDQTISGIGWNQFSPAVEKINVQSEEALKLMAGSIEIKKTGIYRVSAAVYVSSCDTGVATISGRIKRTRSGSTDEFPAEGTIPGASGAAAGLYLNIGPAIARLEAGDRIRAFVSRKGSGSAVVQAATSSITVELVAVE